MVDNLYRFLGNSRECFLRRKVKVHFMRILGNIPSLFLINYLGNPI